MSATTVFGQVRTGETSTHSKRNAVIALTVIALFALSFFVGRATATSHASTSGQAPIVTHPRLSPANAGLIANDVAPVSGTTAQQLSPANRALIANDVAPVSGTTTQQLSPANRALIANDVAPVTPQLSQANTASCVVGRPC